MKNIKDITEITYELIEYYKDNFNEAQKAYSELTTNTRGLDKSKLEGYYEKHHIVPRCMGGLDEDSNYVLLTYPEHVLAHMLLYVLNYSNDKLKISFWLMINNKEKSSSNICVNLILLEKLRIEISNSFSGENNPMRREEIKNKFRGENNPMKREDVREKISKSQLGEKNNAKLLSARRKNSEWHKGRKLSDETRLKMSKSQKLRQKEYGTSNETRLKLSEKLGTKVIFPTGEILNSLTLASKKLGITRYKLKKLISEHPEKGFKYLN